MGGALGFDTNNSSGRSGTSSTSSSFVDQQQAPFLDFLRNMGQSQFTGWGQGQQQFGQMANQLGQQSGMVGGQQNPFIAQMLQQSQGNPGFVQAQTQQLGTNLANQFNEQINPQITAGAVGAGGLGGGRQGVAQGQAIQGQQRALMEGALGFQGQDLMRQQGAAQMGSAAFGQGQQNALAGFGQQFGMAQGAFQSQFDPLFALSQIFGAPNNLQQSDSTSWAANQSRGMGMSIGG